MGMTDEDDDDDDNGDGGNRGSNSDDKNGESQCRTEEWNSLENTRFFY